jgi:hypothetical protein
MVVLCIGGNRIGAWAESEQFVAEMAEKYEEIELRDETSRILGRWELERRRAAGCRSPSFGSRWALNELFDRSVAVGVERTSRPVTRRSESVRRPNIRDRGVSL